MSSTADSNTEKRVAAARSLDYVDSGMRLGLGSGSTAAEMVRLLGERVRAGLEVIGVPTSEATAAVAREVGVPLSTLLETPKLDLVIDGADEVDRQGNLTKGGGGALLREKIVATAADRMIVIVDSKKIVHHLGAFPLPVETIPFARPVVEPRLRLLGADPVLRGGEAEPFRTDEGNEIFDCAFGTIDDPDALAAKLSVIPGVVEHGLFIGYPDIVIVGRGDKAEVLAGPGDPR